MAERWLQRTLVQAISTGYRLIRPTLFQRSAGDAHRSAVELLRRLDRLPLLDAATPLLVPRQPVEVGGVSLPHPLILAAGLVKGDGFAGEAEALDAVRQGHNIIPGWRSLPALVGPVEVGSFTRHPRLGNNDTVMWRDPPSRSTQNRVGLKNPGAVAAAAFLSQRVDRLPAVFGINIAPSPGVDNDTQDSTDVSEAIEAFIARGVHPSWFTLNVSCPNTEDDPGSRQTEDRTRTLCRAARAVTGDIPLWVKISPGLAAEQYGTMMKVFAETGVQAVVATNTIARPTPDIDDYLAGVGGGMLHRHALAAVTALADAGQPIDIIGCGGVMDPVTLHSFRQHGVRACQYWSALVYRGPLVAAAILNED